MVSGTDQEEFLFALDNKNIENHLVSDQILADVRKIVEFLPDDQREVVIMRNYLDMSFKEIAETTGVSINTALGRMRYAIINLRKLVKEHHINLNY
jgi:RNA polymerase sigma-70 factor (ECF subfamily)